MEDNILLPLPEDVEAELDKELDAEIQIKEYGIYPPKRK